MKVAQWKASGAATDSLCLQYKPCQSCFALGISIKGEYVKRTEWREATSVSLQGFALQ